jgi:hypothetical protein
MLSLQRISPELVVIIVSSGGGSGFVSLNVGEVTSAPRAISAEKAVPTSHFPDEGNIPAEV